MKKYKNLIFDVGDVLLQYRWRDMLKDYGLSASEAERIGRELFNDERHLWSQLDLGNKSDEEILSEYKEEYPEDYDVIHWFVNHGEYMHIARPHVWRRVHELKEAGYRIYLLSNYSYSLFRKHTEHADFMNDIDGLLVSYMIHKKKPDPEFYQALFHIYDLDPSECIFFDDKQENVEQSIAQGMDAEQVLSDKDLLKKLERF